jgi:lysophospholipase L1-like esterase
MLKKNSLAAKIICIIFSLCILFSIELTSRIIFPATSLDKITIILKQDPILFWRQKLNIKTKFQGYDVVTDWMGLRNKNLSRAKKTGITRIICLGASPTFGWGVSYEDTYSFRLEKLLNRDSKGSFEVINAGEIGYSTYQGLLFLKNEIIKLKPDIITVSYGLNDIDKYRFFRSNETSDKELKPLNIFLVGLINVIQQSKFVRALERLAFTLNHRGSRYFNSSGAAYLPEGGRVSPADYENNLQEIVNFCLQKRIKLILVKMPVNLPLPKQIAEVKNAESRAYLAKGALNLANHKYETAIKFFLYSKNDNPYLSEAYYYLGVCYEKRGESQMARLYFMKAREQEAFRCGLEGQRYNNIMQTVANKNNTPLVDIVSAFKTNKEYLFVDQKHDPIHPNAIGHNIIALEIYNTLIKSEFVRLPSR